MVFHVDTKTKRNHQNVSKTLSSQKKQKGKSTHKMQGIPGFEVKNKKPWFLRHAHNTPRFWPIKKSCQKYSAFSQALMAAEKLTSLGRTLAAGILRNNSTAHCHCHAFASAFQDRNFGNVWSSSGSLDIQIFPETCGEKAWHLADPNIFSGNIWMSFWGTVLIQDSCSQNELRASSEDFFRWNNCFGVHRWTLFYFSNKLSSKIGR